MGSGDPDQSKGRGGRIVSKIKAQGLVWDQQKIWIQATQGNGRKGKRVTRPNRRVKGHLIIKSLG